MIFAVLGVIVFVCVIVYFASMSIRERKKFAIYHNDDKTLWVISRGDLRLIATGATKRIAWRQMRELLQEYDDYIDRKINGE